jgi:hypothetical protein
VQDTERQQTEGDGAVPEPSGPSPLKIFINYRRDDLVNAWAVYYRLREAFGEENVFFDSKTLQPGVRWFEEIQTHLMGAGVILALIGPKWLDILDTRMRQPGPDYVVTELDLAFRSRARVGVIPVLFDGASVPEAEQLAPALQDLPACQVQNVHTPSLDGDLDDLIASLKSAGLRASPAPRAVDPLDVLPDEMILGAGASDEGDAYADAGHYRLVLAQASNLVIFLGSDANLDGDGDGAPWQEGSPRLPDDRELARYLAAKAGLDDPDPHLAEVAQYARVMCGESVVSEWLRDVLSVDVTPGDVHRFLARMPAHLRRKDGQRNHQMIVTPNYDATLERELRRAKEPFDVVVFMSPGTNNPGKFVHIPWDGMPRVVESPNDETGLPIRDDGRMLRTLIVRISGAVDDRTAGYLWEDNYVITEDDYIEFLSGCAPEQVIPAQILNKLRRASYLFLGYSMSDWRLRVFLRRIWPGGQLTKAKYWAVERAPDEFEREMCQSAQISLLPCSLAAYLRGLDRALTAAATGS